MNRRTPIKSIESLHDYHIQIGTREIYLNGDYSEDISEVNYKMACTFDKNINFLNHQSHKPVIVHLNTIGGTWSDGMAIYDMIRFSPSPVVVVGKGQIASMGSIILQAADLRLMFPFSDMMIHFGSTSVESDITAFESYAEWEKSVKEHMLNIYRDRCIEGEKFADKKPSQVKAYLKKQMTDKQDLYLSASEAVDYGLADGVIGRDYELCDLRNLDLEKIEYII